MKQQESQQALLIGAAGVTSSQKNLSLARYHNDSQQQQEKYNYQIPNISKPDISTVKEP